jgi:hypothetical protein
MVINYTKIAKESLKELQANFPNYKLGEILYSFLRFSKRDVSWLLAISDQDLYAMIEKASEIEKTE